MSPRRTKINDSKSQGDEENLARARRAGRHARPITRRALGAEACARNRYLARPLRLTHRGLV